MRRALVKDVAAEEDLVGIWVYSHQQWGIEQADHYLDRLRKTIESLADAPGRGKQRDALRPGYWSIRAEHHIVFYTFDDQVVRIRRILHGRMDVDQHL